MDRLLFMLTLTFFVKTILTLPGGISSRRLLSPPTARRQTTRLNSEWVPPQEI